PREARNRLKTKSVSWFSVLNLQSLIRGSVYEIMQINRHGFGGQSSGQEVHYANTLPPGQSAKHPTDSPQYILQPNRLRPDRGLAAPPSSVRRLCPALPPRPVCPAGFQGRERRVCATQGGVSAKVLPEQRHIQADP